MAQCSNIDLSDVTSVITSEAANNYKKVIEKISKASTKAFCKNIDKVNLYLSSTAAGKLGAPPKNMMMNFGRYLRKSISQKLYENEFLTDDIPKKGSITVFYENDIEFFN